MPANAFGFERQAARRGQPLCADCRELAADEESFPSPARREEALRGTETEFTAGRIEVLDWEEAKKQLRRRSE